MLKQINEIMNYEKEYKEALLRAKKVHDGELTISPNEVNDFNVYEYIFPELKESDDDKIRKDIIWCLKHSGIEENNPINPHVSTTIKNAITWLEKQGEQNTANFDAAEKEKNDFVSGQFIECRKLESWFEYIGDGTYIGRSDNILNKRFHITPQQLFTLFSHQHCPKEETQGEQKPDFCHHEVDLSNCSEYYRKAYYDGWNNCNQQHAQLEAEQKPTWSEEDEHYLNSVINLVHSTRDGAWGSCVGERIESWLKSLKDRVQSKHWKPSEEQMHELRKVAFQLGNSSLSPFSDKNKELVSLYNDLKNL